MVLTDDNGALDFVVEQSVMGVLVFPLGNAPTAPCPGVPLHVARSDPTKRSSVLQHPGPFSFGESPQETQ